ncbi:unnamed protein product [Tuber aestivum]|uniref:Uncharacterized protein n=1 Tax=Tuber aestivum TaxID=59557 RepID=A0A292PRA8_9PEZI|nr:unnamed protein product [Tuber aestivum]
MENLYHETWGSQAPVFKDFSVRVPQPRYRLPLGYKMSLLRSEIKGLSQGSFATQMVEQAFKKLELGSPLPSGHRQLLVREEYRRTELLLQEAEQMKWSPVTGTRDFYGGLDFAVSGQPGSEERKRLLWILTDEALTNPPWNLGIHSWFVVLAAAPVLVNTSEQWANYRNISIQYMSNWTWGEIVAAFSLRLAGPPTSEEMERLFSTFACLCPVARTCLDSVPATNDVGYDLALKSYLKQLDLEIRAFTMHRAYLDVGKRVYRESTHRIAIIDPTTEALSYTTRIATR